ncbi:MAG TPA: DUF2911 domain-containing protein [Rubricoccaceae bacterium]|nr:DUF2911 domain-containing protein [Rubricoccaceae bacterium]
MRIRSFLLALALLALAPAAAAQMTIPQRGTDEPRQSPNAVVGQTIGTTDVLLTYGRPSVRGRVIFGDLVPYGEVWRTGANEATSFSVSKDVTIEGQPLPAGTYALVTIPTEERWTIVFNRAADQWGAFEYDESQDALRVEVVPEAGPATEMMTFVFENVTDTSGDLVLYWDEVRVPVTIGAE